MRKVSLFTIKEEKPPKSILKSLSKPADSKPDADQIPETTNKTPSTIYGVVVAAKASKDLKEKSKVLMVRSRKRGDWGEYDLAHAWCPDDLSADDGRSSRATQLEREVTNASDFFVNMARPCLMKPVKAFQEFKVKDIIKNVLEENLGNLTYEPNLCKIMSTHLSDQLKERVKRLRYPRYKYVCHVILGDINNQDVRVASRGAWDSSVDSFAVSEYKNFTMFAVGIVFGVYCE